MDAFRSVRGALLQTIHSLLLLPSDSEENNVERVREGYDGSIGERVVGNLVKEVKIEIYTETKRRKRRVV